MPLETNTSIIERVHPHIHCETIDPQAPLLFEGAKGLVFLGDTDEVAVYRRDMRPKNFPGYIDLIGGQCDVKPDGERETPFETASREGGEEIGVNITPESILYAAKYELTGLAGLEGGVGNAGVFFAARVAEPGEAGLRLGDEGDQGSGIMRMSIKDLIDPNRTDVWPAFQQLARQYYEEQRLTDYNL